jgi:DNA-binding HxlR family transcriptional regulator
MLRRPRGEAAQKIIIAFAVLQARELSIHELEVCTGLSGRTLTDNVKMLERDGRVEVHGNDYNLMWISLPE